MIDRSDTKFIIVSASGTPPAMDFGARELAWWYEGKRSRFWCPWHFVTRRGGDVEEGRSVQYRGEAPAGYKAISLSVLLVGGQSETEYCKSKSNFSREQMIGLETICRKLVARYPGAKVVGVSALPGVRMRSNPGFDVAAWADGRNITSPQGSVDGTDYPASASPGTTLQRSNLADLQAFRGADRGDPGGEPCAPREVADARDDTPRGVL